MTKVLLVSMPFGALERPALGISLLKAQLTASGIPCDVRYPNLAFAEYIGYDTYQWLSFELPYTAFAGDWAFTSALYGERPDDDRRYIDEVLRRTWHLDDAGVARLLRVRALVPHFLVHALAAIPWGDYGIVGFTSTFEQNIASLAMARRVKLAHPDIVTVFGGANWEGEMGATLHAQFPFVDYVCSGEADESFPALVQRLRAGTRVDEPTPVPGIVFRARDRSVATPPAPLMRDLDQLPMPDFSDYFRTIEESTTGASIVPTLLIESSRGCWWGAKSHCTFCGLNGGSMAFRSKSAARVEAELEYLADRWRVDLIEAVDNILDMHFFRDLLPALARAHRPLQIFYEVKANLTRAQVEILRDAGVRRIQPGIESLSDHVLRLMRKGTTALRNIQLLKWCKTVGIKAEWNLLYGFPGETQQDYDAMLPLLRAIRFFDPPTACGPIRLDRFSPYYTAPESFGLRNVRPLASYQFLYPLPTDVLSKIAYYFDFDYAPEVDPGGAAADVIAFIDDWQRTPERGTLCSVDRAGDGLVLIDTRTDATLGDLALHGLERAAYEYCDSLRSIDSVCAHLRERFPGAAVPEHGVRGFLDGLVAHRFMITDGTHYLSLAIPTAPVQGRASPGTPQNAAVAVLAS